MSLPTRPSRTELHFHLLPGVDDGPRTMEGTVELARAAVADGTTTVVATPHVREVVVDELPERAREVQSRLDAEGVALTVVAGGEVAHDDVARLSTRELDVIAHGPVDARWVLLEAPLFARRGDWPAAARDLLAATDELRARGFGVLLGHPERSPSLFLDGSSALERELALGTPLQVNATSLLGRHGPEAQAWGRRLVAEGRAAVIASDAHSLERGPSLTSGIEAAVAAGLARAQAARLTDTVPARLLEEGLSAASR